MKETREGEREGERRREREFLILNRTATDNKNTQRDKATLDTHTQTHFCVCEHFKHT